jgi:serine phosphatase RsbU (regulator of sigma subunit)
MPLVGNGLPLGLFVDAQFEEHEVALAAQFSIVALSDGILEILPTGDLPSKEALLKAHVAAAATDFEALNLRLGLPTAKDLPDDIALLMITRYE